MIQGYSNKDAGYYPREYKGAEVFGIELEVEAKRVRAPLPSQYHERDSVSRDHAYSWLRDVDGFKLADKYVVCKSDGSLNSRGFEIVTRPDGLAQHKRRWEGFFAATPGGCMTSWSGGRCGMHVHVNRGALSELQLGKMLVFINEPTNQRLVSAVAGRYRSQWCRYSPKTLTSPKDGCDGRRVAVNCENANTVELRIFRGTIVRRAFMKNLEFVAAVVAFCGADRRSFCESKSGTGFCRYVRENRKLYPNLFGFLVEANFCEALRKRGPNDTTNGGGVSV